MSIRSAYLIVAAATLTLCPVPQPAARHSPAAPPPAVRPETPPAPPVPSPPVVRRGTPSPSYPPHAPPVVSRPAPPPARAAGSGPDRPPPPVYDHRYGGAPAPSVPIPSPGRDGDPPGPPAPPAAPGPAETPGGAVPERTDARWGAPVLVEDFDGDRIDQSRWEVYHSPGAAVNPRTAEATTVHDGMLHMTGGFYDGKDLSGGVASRMSQTYGRWEVRFRGEPGRGYSLVTLLWPESQSPEYAEVDFAEVIDATRRSAGIYVHRGQSPQAQSLVRADFTRWHTAAVDWTPGRLTFWLDGRRTWDYTGPNVPAARPMHLTLQNDVVCNQWSPCRDATTPATVSMFVDWVKIYRAP
ncbi:hypothetical protein Skr01_57550 [Sphaerisporangium krabiense]|uniref:GH16 domain-containing protein n=1 Tax=Sphaerisporangium krabiense TaxID=763782 RepID=A0A7W8Z8P9_9ACTN|nr:glycoside hydrolase family 16 protein [Sphaerisporangium krabiense]MBB5629479.1 hypothetical protein [Sphaerisporangium krabiense]GII65670.1 hypothetical protein Skr01_57550 [Sphaerisporangium krabiense]